MPLSKKLHRKERVLIDWTILNLAPKNHTQFVKTNNRITGYLFPSVSNCRATYSQVALCIFLKYLQVWKYKIFVQNLFWYFVGVRRRKTHTNLSVVSGLKLEAIRFCAIHCLAGWLSQFCKYFQHGRCAFEPFFCLADWL